MGQTSSQLEPSSVQQAIAEQSARQAENKLPKHKPRKIKESKQRVGQNHGKEEHARALVQMQEGAVNTIRRPSIEGVEDDKDASSQLMNESYRTQAPAISDLEPNHKRFEPSEKTTRKRHEEQKRKLGEIRTEEGSFMSEQRRGSPVASATQPVMDDIDELFEERPDVPQTSLTLDDIHSDDGDIASLLQDYEAEGLGSYSLNNSREQPKEEQSENIVSAVDRSGAPPSCNGPDGERGKKRKKKLKKRSSPSSNLYVDEGPEPLNDTGQHSFDIDFEAFDNFCAANNVGPANLFDDIPEQALPVDPKLMEDNQEAAHDNDGAVDADGLDPSPLKARKKRRLSSSSKHKQKHKRTEIADPLVSHSLLFDSPNIPNNEQQDRVLPGFEDMQRQSSQEAHYSKASGGSSRQGRHPSKRYRNASSSMAQKRSKDNGEASDGTQDPQLSSPVAEGGARQGGAFTGPETAKLEEYRDDYCENHGVSLWHFNELIQARQRDKPKAPDMWQGMYEILPHRKKTSIQRFCRRRFHNFEVRGTWTAEDDEHLLKAVEEKGKSWIAVGQIMNRFAEDVRDRYRNYLVNAEYRNKEHWSDSEMRNLVRAVLDCIQFMRQQRIRTWEASYEGRDLPDTRPNFDQDEDDYKLINWQSVSDRMHGTRSRLQCSFKWSHLKDEDKRRFMKEVRAAKKGRKIREVEVKPTKNPWRAMKAMKRAQLMRSGDKYELLLALSTCTAFEEDNIPWKALGNEEFRAKWTAPDKKAAWQMMKERLSFAEQSDYQDIVNKLLTTQMYEDQNLDEKWDPQIHGYGSAPPPKTASEKAEHKKRKYQEKLEKTRKRRHIKRENQPADAYKVPQAKSTPFVAESDDEDVDESTTAVKDHGSGTHSTSDSRGSSNAFAANEGVERGAEAAETTDSSVDGLEEDELPKSR